MSGINYVHFPLILAAPSGAGKTSVAHRLKERRSDLRFSISATTRARRSHETDDRDYHFIEESAFRQMIEDGALLEWAEVHGHLYGTLRRSLDEARASNQHLLLDIDVQGAAAIRKLVADAVLVFIFPPTAESLAGRLFRRGSEADAVRRRRLANATGELLKAPEFDYIVVNDDLDQAVDRVEAILDAESLRPSRALDLAGEIERLRSGISARLQGNQPS